MTIILFLAVLALLVLVHELGHFVAAKWAKVAVDEFAIGFPPRLWSKKVGPTLYSLNLILFGGFVKLRGEDGSETYDPDGLGAKSRPKQVVIMAAGVVANLVLAWLFLSLALFLGLPASIATAPKGAELSNISLMIVAVKDGSPADVAGLKPGDKILTLQKDAETLSAPEVAPAIDLITKNASPVQISYQRSGTDEIKTISITPTIGLVKVGEPAIGVSFDKIGIVKLGPTNSFIEGAAFTTKLTMATVVGLGQIIKQAVVGKENLLDSFVGPVGLAGLVGDAHDFGLPYLLSFIAFISVNLAVFNLIPFPALDGGRILVLGVEGLLRRPLPAKVTTWLNVAGFICLIGLMLIITAADIIRLF